jgi:hypothetical protein
VFVRGVLHTEGSLLMGGSITYRTYPGIDRPTYPTIVGFSDFSNFSPWWEVSKTDRYSLFLVPVLSYKNTLFQRGFFMWD